MVREASPAILARGRCVCWSSRPWVPMARRPWPCAGARAARSKTGQSERAQARFLADIENLQRRIASGRLRQEAKIHEAIGRLKERYSRVARYCQIHYEPAAGLLCLARRSGASRRKPKPLMAAICSRRAAATWTPRKSGAPTFCLPRVESAFRTMKSPLCERPIFHHLERRVETHIFLCVLAYHLLVCIERAFLDRGIHTSWETLPSNFPPIRSSPCACRPQWAPS